LVGSLKAEGFGEGGCGKSHPQAFDKLRRGAALEAATLESYQINFDRLLDSLPVFLFQLDRLFLFLR